MRPHGKMLLRQIFIFKCQKLPDMSNGKRNEEGPYHFINIHDV